MYFSSKGGPRIGVHQLVAYVFLGFPPTMLHTVDHINSEARDNRVDNLRWASLSEQSQHAVPNRPCGVDLGAYSRKMVKLTKLDTLEQSIC